MSRDPLRVQRIVGSDLFLTILTIIATAPMTEIWIGKPTRESS